MKRICKKFSSIVAVIGVLSSMTAVNATAAGFESSTVYQVCVEENQYTQNGVYVHEYVWEDPSSNGISLASNLDDATWQTSNLENNVVVNHRGAKEYSNTSSGTRVWNAHAETKAYRNGSEGIYNKTTVKIVNAIFTSSVKEEKTSSWAKGHTSAITKDGALASEPLLAMRSYWSTDF